MYACRVCESNQERLPLWRRWWLPLHLAWKAVSIGMVRSLSRVEWSGPLSGQPFGGSAIGDSKCRIYRERTPNTHSYRHRCCRWPGGISRARTTMEGCHSVSRSFAGFSLLRHAVPHCPGYCLRVEGPMWCTSALSYRKYLDSFHVNNIKMSIDARTYGAEKFAWIMTWYQPAWYGTWISEGSSKRLGGCILVGDSKKPKTHKTQVKWWMIVWWRY